MLELALLAPMLALLTIGLIDMSNAFSRKLALEQGAQRAINKIMQTTELTTVADSLKTEVCDQVDGVDSAGNCLNAPITNDNVTVGFRFECSNDSGQVTTQTTTDADALDNFTCPPGSAEAKYISVSVADKYKPLFPIHFVGYDSRDGAYHISATASLRTL